MISSNIAFDEGTNGFRSTESPSSGSPGISGSTASFYHADLDKVQRKLSGVHVQMYVRSRFLVYVSLHSLVIIRFAVCATYFGSRELRCIMYNSHQIAGVIGTGLFLGLGQLLAITGPLGVLLVFLLVGSVAFASVLSSVPNSRSDLEAMYLVAP
jgi:hypothetical protein